jgi:hypothetical protein
MSKHISVNNNTNFKSFWILSIDTIWDGLSLKTISRYCPFKLSWFFLIQNKFFCLFFGGLECVGHFFAYFTYLRLYVQYSCHQNLFKMFHVTLLSTEIFYGYETFCIFHNSTCIDKFNLFISFFFLYFLLRTPSIQT